MAFELPDGKTARNIQEQVAFLTGKVKDLIAFVNQAGLKSIQIVEELPEVGDPTVLYLLEKEDPDTGDYYDEYLWIDEAWELIGSTQIDLSNYPTLTGDNTYTGTNDFTTGVQITVNDQISKIVNTGNLDLDFYINNNAIYRMATSSFRPLAANKDLGSSIMNWKDLYLSGKAYIGNLSIYTQSNGANIIEDTVNYNDIQLGIGLIPKVNNTKSLGSSSNAWKDLYLCGNIKLDNTNDLNFITVANQNCCYFKPYVIVAYNLEPPVNAGVATEYTIGTANKRFGAISSIDANISGNITDGTYSASVEALVKKARLYKHKITTSGGDTLNVITTVSTAYTTFDPAMFDNAIIFKVGVKTALSYNYGGGQMTNIYYVEYNGTLTSVNLSGQTITTDEISDV